MAKVSAIPPRPLQSAPLRPAASGVIPQALRWPPFALGRVHGRAQCGQLELCATVPLIARNLLESIRLLANAARIFAERCLAGLDANRGHAASLVEQSLAMATALAPRIGYDRAAEIAKASTESGRSVRELCLERGVLPPEELAELLDPLAQTGRR